MRKQFKDTVTELAAQDDKLVVVLGDISHFLFHAVPGEISRRRCYNMGICENALISVAAGLEFAGFSSVRAHDCALPHRTELRADQARPVLQPFRRQHRDHRRLVRLRLGRRDAPLLTPTWRSCA